MAIGPLATICAVAGGVKTVRRVHLSAGVVRYESWLGPAAVVAMLVFLAGALMWVIEGDAGPRGLFQSGAGDVVDTVMMAGALAAAVHLARRVRRRPAGNVTPTGTSAAPPACG